MRGAIAPEGTDPEQVLKDVLAHPKMEGLDLACGVSTDKAYEVEAVGEERFHVIAYDFGAGSMTESGYPRLVKLWKRGQPLGEATVVHEGRVEDIGVFATLVRTPERDYPMVIVAPTFFTRHFFGFPPCLFVLESLKSFSAQRKRIAFPAKRAGNEITIGITGIHRDVE